MHHEGQHLCKARQDCFHHQRQEREILGQEPHVALSYTTSGTIQIGRVSVDQEEEEQ
jgi:ABC-type hemin transport system ATPase subunit